MGHAGVMVGWREATREALYGRDGFFRREAPGAHFRTSAHTSPLFAKAIARLAAEVGVTTVVDVGSGRGELLLALHETSPALKVIGVELSPEPSNLPQDIDWMTSVPTQLRDVLVVANEWLDNIPVDVVEVDETGTVRRVDVEPTTGEEWLTEPVSGRDAEWLATWWPLENAPPSTRAEVGWPRDEAWANLVRAVEKGVAVAIDYGHVASNRPPYGSLTAYRRGRQTHPVPDGSRDITSHVALDAVAAAGKAAGATQTVLTTQSPALKALGIHATLPPHELARSDPARYAAALAEVSGARELLASGGLGGFGWLLQGIHQPLPGVFVDLDDLTHP
jgi:SAM-dependent MidA family methyltransferase